jgi:hypothetical protein
MESGKKRTVILLSVAGVLLAVAAYRLFTGSRATAVLPSQYTVEGVCLACKGESRATQSVRERPPLECEKCKARALYFWFYCPDCGKQFVPELERRSEGPPALPIVIRCPGCKSARGTQYEPNDPEQKPTGKLGLPKWP